MSQDRLLTPQDAAELLNVTPSWIVRAAREKVIPCVYVGRFPRFRRESLVAWIEECEQTPTRSVEFRKYHPELGAR